MKPLSRKALGTAPPILLGVVLIALSMVWSSFHPGRAVVVVEGLAFSLGTTPRGGYQRHSWVVRNAGSRPLKLRTRFTSGRCGFSLWLGEDLFIPAGGQWVVSLTCPVPERDAAPYSAQAEVLTSDADRPRVLFRVIGITGPSHNR